MDIEWWTSGGGERTPSVRVGPQDGPPVVAVPGLTDGLAPLWDDAVLEQLARLPAASSPLALRLVGYPDRLASDVTTRDLAGHVVAWLDANVGTPVTLVAHSLGGMVAQWVAIMRPDLLHALVLTASSASAGDGARALLQRWERLLDEGRVTEQVEDALRVSFTGSALLRRLVAARVLGPPDVTDRLARHRALTHAALTHDTTDELARVPVPTLVLAGELDPVFPVSAARLLATSIPSARLEVLPGLAHGFPEQARSSVHARVVDVVATAETERAG